jgi:2-polyprenyl-3-methyl-5-hydroxy-6-metoxy-1,4-benzoquinol methylase
MPADGTGFGARATEFPAVFDTLASMALTAAQEKSYYEQQYARFLELPAGDLRFTPGTFLADLRNPRKEVFERRILYTATLDALGALNLQGKRALDYGCGTGDFGLWMATAEGASVTFLDLSENAVAVCLKRAQASGVGGRCDGEARDAADLSCFGNATFDVIFGCASLHHTIKYPGAWNELLRVLKPEGSLVLTETFGNNPLLNTLRRWNWRRTCLPDEQGEDVIFNDQHVAILRDAFCEVSLHPMHLMGMAKRAVRGRYHRWPVRALMGALLQTDKVLLALLPFLKRHCGEVLVIATGRKASP